MILIEGHVEEGLDPDLHIRQLEDQISDLHQALSQAKGDLAHHKRETARALASLRRQLSPLYRALQGVFDELGAAGVSDDPSGTTVDGRVSAVWASWKSKMGNAACVIDALLLHTEMNTQQLAIATGKHRTTIPALIHKLNKAGLLNKNGGKFSLKQL